jgi:hypothetical protein
MAVVSGSGAWNSIYVGPEGLTFAFANGNECQIDLSSGGILQLTNQGSKLFKNYLNGIRLVILKIIFYFQ